MKEATFLAQVQGPWVSRDREGSQQIGRCPSTRWTHRHTLRCLTSSALDPHSASSLWLRPHVLCIKTQITMHEEPLLPSLMPSWPRCSCEDGLLIMSTFRVSTAILQYSFGNMPFILNTISWFCQCEGHNMENTSGEEGILKDLNKGSPVPLSPR